MEIPRANHRRQSTMMQIALRASKFRRVAIAVIFGSQVSLQLCYCKRGEVQPILQNCCGKTMDDKWPYIANVFSELYKNMVNKVILQGFRGATPPLWIRS